MATDTILVVVTHERLDFTKNCIGTLLDSLTSKERAATTIVVVDNASTDGTREWLQQHKEIDRLVLNTTNRYPGAACNQGWMLGLIDRPYAKYLGRIDNDMQWDRQGWLTSSIETMEAMPKLGQLGLFSQRASFRQDPEAQRLPHKMPVRIHEEKGFEVNRWWSNIGGTCLVRRELWDDGLRYDEAPWRNLGGPTAQEDVKLSLAVASMGYFFANTLDEFCTEMSFDNTDQHYDYYVKTFTDRGHAPPARIRDGEVVEEGLRHV